MPDDPAARLGALLALVDGARGRGRLSACLAADGYPAAPREEGREQDRDRAARSARSSSIVVALVAATSGIGSEEPDGDSVAVVEGVNVEGIIDDGQISRERFDALAAARPPSARASRRSRPRTTRSTGAPRRGDERRPRHRLDLGEAEERGIEASEREVEQEFQRTKDENFKTEKEYQEFLEETGFTQEDIDLRVEAPAALAPRSRRRSAAEPSRRRSPRRTPESSTRRTRSSSRLPASRDIRLVQAQDDATAQKAFDQLSADNSPENWNKVAADALHRRRPRRTTAASARASPRAPSPSRSNGEIFERREGEVVGPGQRPPQGSYVFQVDAITEATTTSFEDAREQIDQQLGPQIQQEEFSAFLSRLPRPLDRGHDLRRRLHHRALRQLRAARPRPAPTRRSPRTSRSSSSSRPAARRRCFPNNPAAPGSFVPFAPASGAPQRPHPPGEDDEAPQAARSRRRAPRRGRPGAARRAAPPRGRARAPGRRAGRSARRLSPRAQRSARARAVAGAPRRDHPAPAPRVPLGPRAGRPLDRPPHRRGVLRAGRRRRPRRHRGDARRARRRPLPGGVPGPAARGARRGRPRRRRRVLHREADPPPPARLRRRGDWRTAGRGAEASGRRSSATSRAARPSPSAEIPENLPVDPVRAQGPAADRPRGLVGLRASPGARRRPGRARRRRARGRRAAAGGGPALARARRRPRARALRGGSPERLAVDAPRLPRPVSTISEIRARQILDSRGNPTVEAEVDARVRRVRLGGRSLGRLDRRVRGRRAARRRRRVGRQGRLEGRRQRQRRDRRRPEGRARRRAVGARRDDDRARRHARTRAAWAPTRSSASRSPPPRPRPPTPAGPSTRTSASSTRRPGRRTRRGEPAAACR